MFSKLSRLFGQGSLPPDPANLDLESDVIENAITTPAVSDPVVDVSKNEKLEAFNCDAAITRDKIRVAAEAEQVRQTAWGLYVFMRDEFLAGRISRESSRFGLDRSMAYSTHHTAILKNHTNFTNKEFDKRIGAAVSQFAQENGWAWAIVTWNQEGKTARITITEEVKKPLPEKPKRLPYQYAVPTQWVKQGVPAGIPVKPPEPKPQWEPEDCRLFTGTDTDPLFREVKNGFNPNFGHWPRN